MRNVYYIFFTLIMLIYGMLSALNLSTMENRLFQEAGGENSLQMYVLLLLAFVLSCALLASFPRLRALPTICKLFLAYLVYNSASAVLTTIFMGNLKYTGTALVFSGLPMLTFLAFYFFSFLGVVGKRVFVLAFMLLFALDLIVVFSVFSTLSFFQNSVVLSKFYQMFSVLPCLLLVDFGAFSAIIFLLMSIFVAYSAKRGAFLSLVSGGAAYYFVKGLVENKVANIVLISFTIFLLLVSMFFFVDFSFILERLDTIGEDRGSGRIDIWLAVINSFCSSNIFEVIFGHGAYYGSKDFLMPLGVYGAHNDFLGILYDNGLIGFSMLLGMFYCAFRDGLYLIKVKSPIASVFIMFLVCLFILSNISAVFLGAVEYFSFFAFWGFVSGIINYEKRNLPPHIRFQTQAFANNKNI